MLVQKIAGNSLVFPSSYDVLGNYLFLFNQASFKIFDLNCGGEQVAQLSLHLSPKDQRAIFYNLLLSDGGCDFVVANLSKDRKYVLVSWYVRNKFVSVTEIEIPETVLWIRKAGQKYLLVVTISGGGQLITFSPNDAKTELLYKAESIRPDCEFMPFLLTDVYKKNDEILISCINKGSREILSKDNEIPNKDSYFKVPTGQPQNNDDEGWELHTSFEYQKDPFIHCDIQFTGNGFIFHSNDAVYCHDLQNLEQWKMSLPKLQSVAKLTPEEFIILADGCFYSLKSKTLEALKWISVFLGCKGGKVTNIISMKANGEGDFFLQSTNGLYWFREKALHRIWKFDEVVVKICTF